MLSTHAESKFLTRILGSLKQNVVIPVSGNLARILDLVLENPTIADKDRLTRLNAHRINQLLGNTNPTTLVGAVEELHIITIQFIYPFCLME